MCGSVFRSLLFLSLSFNYISYLTTAQSTPVIGGLCDLGAAEVQIGGKQTQFFLKCESNQESEENKGVWVVKSRNAASPTAIPQPSTTLPPANTEPQQHPKQLRKQQSIICAQELNAREADSCATPATCLQLNNEEASSFLQCDQSNNRWVKKSCSDGHVFSFEQQACIPSAKAPNRHYARTKNSTKCLTKKKPHSKASRTLCKKPTPVSSDSACNNGTNCRLHSSATENVVHPLAEETLKTEGSRNCSAQSCTLLQPCDDGYDCVNGRCCESSKLRCSSGQFALSFPHDCDSDSDCPIMTRCERARCCPLQEQQTTQNTSLLDSANRIQPSESEENPLFQRLGRTNFAPTGSVIYDRRECKNHRESLSTPSNCSDSDDCPQGYICEDSLCCFTDSIEITDLGKQVMGHSGDKENCLPDHNCQDSIICPEGFTCTHAGKCCEFGDVCPDKSIPSSECQNGLCPGASEDCITRDNDQLLCCPASRVKSYQQTVQNFVSASGLAIKPSKLLEVNPETDAPRKCVFSISCPITHYCGLNGVCTPYGAKKGYSTGSQGVVCTFMQCSNSNPCSQGTCNNGYCCTSGSSSSPIIQGKKDTSNITLLSKTDDAELFSNDWPIGPPGYGFPAELANLDSVLVKATGDGRMCAAGFISSLKCSANGECPPGLFCDPSLSLCCPLLLPITDNSNTADQYSHQKRLSPKSYGSYPISSSSSSCPGCGSAPSGGQVITIPSYSPTSSSSSSSSCTAGCPRGYSGCCGTQQASCCLRQQCPGGLPSTGRSCFRSCPSGQICVSGVCCPQLTCPSGGQPYGSCINGYCSPGYQCMQSTGMCCPQVQMQQTYSSCPSGGTSVGQCIGGSCGQGYSCVKSMNLCCPSTTTNPFVCPDGTQAVGGCINGQCGSGFTCTNGLCCNGTSQNPRCLDGSQAVGACINGRCGAGYTCTTGNICCTSTATLATCPNGGTSIGLCVNGLCPNGYTCINEQCCPTNAATFTCDTNAAHVGPCVNGNCPGGFSCDTSINQCCPTGAVLDACVVDAVTGIADCPQGYNCYPAQPEAGVEQMCYESCNGNAAAEVGPIIATDQCPPGSTPILSVCCSVNRLHRSPTRKSAFMSTYAEPLPGVMNMNTIGSCPGGSPAVSGCMNGLCGAGFECINNMCCSYDAKNMVVYSASATRPIGAACDYSEQCVGYAEGLSTCEIGNCRCLPIAYTQGIACVRRRALSLKFNDALPIENSDSNSTTAAPAASSTTESQEKRPSEK